jgi:ribosomal protein S12 methylthiotransferase
MPKVPKCAPVDKRTIHFIALGCPKNRVDTERMLGLATALGLRPVAEPGEADVIVCNTCGFIDKAKEESIDAVLELAQHKAERCSTLVMAGCLSQRYPEELAAELPEVDHFVGTADLASLEQILSLGDVERVAVTPAERATHHLDDRYERVRVDQVHTAYLKIAEGCDRRCAFCIIPALRGPQQSRSIDSLVQEAKALVAAGALELNLVAQDTTAWGRDLAAAPHLADVLEALDRVEALRWIRVLYAYPTAVDDRLIAALRDLPRVVPYLDLPLQHADDLVLRRMRRGHGGDEALALVQRLRAAIPGIHLRSTLLCGHPGETAEAHQRLLRFVEQAELDHLGVFPFSAEEGTAAATQEDQVPTELARQRADEVMLLQREISRRRLEQLRGQRLQVLVDGESEESEYLLQGRHAGQAPEVDGVVVLTDCEGVQVGELIEVEVTDSGDYDLVARPTSSSSPLPSGLLGR